MCKVSITRQARAKYTSTVPNPNLPLIGQLRQAFLAGNMAVQFGIRGGCKCQVDLQPQIEHRVHCASPSHDDAPLPPLPPRTSRCSGHVEITITAALYFQCGNVRARCCALRYPSRNSPTSREFQGRAPPRPNTQSWSRPLPSATPSPAVALASQANRHKPSASQHTSVAHLPRAAAVSFPNSRLREETRRIRTTSAATTTNSLHVKTRRSPPRPRRHPRQPRRSSSHLYHDNHHQLLVRYNNKRHVAVEVPCARLRCWVVARRGSDVRPAEPISA